jgi:hypothetical protein
MKDVIIALIQTGGAVIIVLLILGTMLAVMEVLGQTSDLKLWEQEITNG